ncbi:MAG: ParA family protein [Oscillospiraceae bacterium]|nr:ParA family protein [Oscillospiraceae bacterium]MBR3963295.1 ParA family protein [Oscillospiraceae bacterium]MBR6657143.1 ParA family protein [Oscillospiraceae bacterium]
MGKIIAFANQKGGVGKTTTAVNLSAALAYRTRGRVLLVDSDPQGNATSGLGINKREVKHSVYDVVIGNCGAKEAVIRTKYKNLDIIPSSIDLAAAEIELVDMENRALRLKNSIAAIQKDYDYICIDCPPSLGLLTLNALAACTSILVPIQCEFYALEGLSQLMATVRTVKRLYNSYIDMEGVLLTMYDARLNLTMQVVEEVKKYFPQKVFKTVIPRNVRLSEAPSFGEPVIYYDFASKGSQSYLALADEIIANNRTEG